MKTFRARVLDPRTIIPAVIAFGLLGAVLAVGDPAKVWALTMRAGWPAIALVGGLTVPYLAARGLVWRQLLAQQGARVPMPTFLVAFAAGEFAKDLPGGAYVEDYLLSRASVPVAKSVTATTALSALEAIFALPFVLVWGVPGWPWLRPAIEAILAAYVVMIALLWFLTGAGNAQSRRTHSGALQPALHSVQGFLKEARHLVAWRTIRENLLPTAVYCGIVLFDILLLGRTVGARGLGVREAAVVFGFITLSLVLLPIPTSLGVTEASGVGALVAFGASPAEAVAILLLLRVLLTGTTMFLTGLVMLSLWGRLPRDLSAAAHESESPRADDHAIVPATTCNESRVEP